MNRSYFHSFFAVLAALTLASSAFGAPTSAGTVLCVGEDGHVEREAAVNGICTDDIGGSHATPSENLPFLIAMGHPATEHCGPCTDTEILAASRGVATRSNAVHAPFQTVIPIASVESLSAPIQSLSHAQFICHPVIDSNYVRSVSLRI